MLRFGEIKEKGQKALLMGDPNFDMQEKEKNSTLKKLALSTDKDKGIIKRSSDMRGFHFTRLPGTREEVKAIHALFGEEKADLYTGDEALEEVLKQKGAASFLHLATHGFFLSDLDLSNLMDDRMSRGIQLISITPTTPGKKVKIENPLLRSGTSPFLFACLRFG